jgi:hypothetical protein
VGKAERALSDALALLTDGGDVNGTRQCLAALLHTLWHRHSESPPAIVSKFREACDIAIKSTQLVRSHRGIFMAHLASGLAVVGERFEDPNLVMEALALLRTAERLVTEQEQPTDWAQIQLLLHKLERQVSSSGGVESGPRFDDIRRAREILNTVARNPNFPTETSSELEDLLRYADDEGIVKAETIDQPVLHGWGAQPAHPETDEGREKLKPRYLLDFDFKRQHAISDVVMIFNRVRAIHK